LEYLQAPGKLLSALYRLLPRDASMVLSIINFESARYARPGSGHGRWIFRPRLDELRNLLKQNGWRVVKEVAFRGQNGPGEWFFNWWSRRLGCDHPWTRKRARQFILHAHAA